MPRRDGTGPNGMGSRSGRGLGMCTGTNAPVFGRGGGAGYGRRVRNGIGFGARWGMGNGSGRLWGNSPAVGDGYFMARDSLQERAANLEAELSALRQRIAEMEKGEIKQSSPRIIH